MRIEPGWLDEDLDARIPSWGEELPSHATSEEVPRGAAGAWDPSIDYTQTLEDHGVLASVGSVGDAYDNAMAESFLDSFKTELIADRSWRNRSQLELAVVEYVAWFNNERLHEALGDRTPREIEEPYAVKEEEPHPSNERWEPTHTVSVKASPAQSPTRGGGTSMTCSSRATHLQPTPAPI
jgi:hypothetical protein